MDDIRIVYSNEEELEKMGYELRDDKVYPIGYWMKLGGDFNGTAIEAYEIVSNYCDGHLYMKLYQLINMNIALVRGQLNAEERDVYFREEREFFEFFDRTFNLEFKFTDSKFNSKDSGCCKVHTNNKNVAQDKPKVRKIKLTGCIRNERGLVVGYEYLHNNSYGKLWSEELDNGLKDGTIELEKVMK